MQPLVLTTQVTPTLLEILMDYNSLLVSAKSYEDLPLVYYEELVEPPFRGSKYSLEIPNGSNTVLLTVKSKGTTYDYPIQLL